MDLIKYLNNMFKFKKKKKCSCGDTNCKRKVVATSEGKLSIKNHFSCKEIKDIIINHKDFI